MELFKGWFHDHFLKHAVSARPLLLLLDGHSTHYNPDVIRLAKQNDVIIITLVPHTTHEMQPLDTSVFALLKGHWRDVCHEFLQSNPGKVISKYQFSSLLSKAWFKSLNPTNIINGFKYSGIHVYPFNPEVALERIYPTSGPISSSHTPNIVPLSQSSLTPNTVSSSHTPNIVPLSQSSLTPNTVSSSHTPNIVPLSQSSLTPNTVSSSHTPNIVPLSQSSLTPNTVSSSHTPNNVPLSQSSLTPNTVSSSHTPNNVPLSQSSFTPNTVSSSHNPKSCLTLNTPSSHTCTSNSVTVPPSSNVCTPSNTCMSSPTPNTSPTCNIIPTSQSPHTPTSQTSTRKSNSSKSATETISKYLVQQLQFATLPKVDYDIGQESFIIETPFMKDFVVNAYIDSDSPEDIAQKIYSVTNIPVPYMSLYVRKDCIFEKLNTFTELNDEDIIRVVLRNPQEVVTPRSSRFGCHSYNPLVTQTNEGVSKFFSILKFLCSVQIYNKTYKFEKLLFYILKITEFPPLVHALYTLKEQSFLTIAGWTALIEGCYFLFKAILNDQIHVPNDKVFEYADYTWGLLICLSKEISEADGIEFNQVSLVCPLSEKRIQTPVRVLNNPDLGPYDKMNILSAPQSLSKNGILEVSADNLTEDEDTVRYLMYYPWESDDKIFTWEKPPEPNFPQICKKVCVQYNLDVITDSLSELCIVHPHGLFAGNECLTYIYRGQLVYFLGAAKGTDERRRLYSPVSSNEEYILSLSKAELLNIGHQQLKQFVSHDLTANVQDGIHNPQKLNATRLSAIIEPQESVQWEPEEVIVVLLDHSGSMESAVYPEYVNFNCINLIDFK
ncbi:PREDICTED: uncharacterized protein LOC109586066 [Amphimedon queenslandica]|uniref:DDE-1 domain-containing protein n=1 Tax=Amphimedon queenslandica TaxID=400682 RepID=A0AAN0JLD3_AMPQE|nr:PREDICTED: uncharacterized protein LOC109586066 [Amphimedon queenslandica]|eukprot:XP_019857802.1 PREDICTED: uncharacterized protein LOC109586066 [Amphimedon queenslandica]